MRAAELLALCSAAGVDLTHAGGIASNLDGEAAERKRTREELRDGVDVVATAKGTGSRTYRRPYWSLAELGMAAGGIELGELPWYAARYSFAGDQSCYWSLWWGLLYQAQRMARREGWQPRVIGRSPRDARTGKLIPGAVGEPQFYLLDLAQLVLDEDAHRWLFVGPKSIPRLHALYLRVEDPTWECILEPRYRSLQACYERWLNIARATIQRRLMQDPDPPQ
jgi:hypothetical protein